MLHQVSWCVSFLFLLLVCFFISYRILTYSRLGFEFFCGGVSSGLQMYGGLLQLYRSPGLTGEAVTRVVVWWRGGELRGAKAGYPRSAAIPICADCAVVYLL